jgi:DNA-binding CsgD family transcriptional regulator
MRRGTGKRQPVAADHAAEVVRQDRRAQVLALTVDGLSLRKIAAQIGISHEQVRSDLAAALDERGKETKAHARALAKERIEAIIAANLPKARGDYSDVDPALLLVAPSMVDCGKLVLAAMALDARINGYEAPAKLDVNGGVAIAIQVSARLAESFADPAEDIPMLAEPNSLNGSSH